MLPALRHLLTVALFAGILCTSGRADVKYEQKTKVKFAGKLGSVMSVMGKLGGAPTELTETVYVQGDRMRTDRDDEMTIIDLVGRRFVTRNEKDGPCTYLTFDEMRERFRKTMAQVEAGKPQIDEEPAAEPDKESTTEVKFDISFDRTGEKKKINGIKAERFILTLTAEATNVAEEDAEEQGVDGTLVTVIEMWLSKDVKGYGEVEAFQKRMAEVMGEAMFTGGFEGLQSAFASDPRMKTAMEKAQEEMAGMEGVPVRSTTYMVLVPAGVEFQRDLVFGSKKKKKKSRFGGLGGLAKKAMESKLGVEGDETDRPEEPKQQTILTVTNDLQNISTKKLSQKLFDVEENCPEK